MNNNSNVTRCPDIACMFLENFFLSAIIVLFILKIMENSHIFLL